MNPQSKQHISLLLLIKNEESRILTNFQWLKDCPRINQLVVIDDHSTDKTVSLLQGLATKDLKVEVYNRDLAGDFAAQRNFGLSKCNNEWILWLDADEFPHPLVINFLNKFNTSKSCNYAFKRLDCFLGSHLRHGENFSQHFLRLFHKSPGGFIGKVHEIWNSKRRVSFLPYEIYHQPHKNLSEFLKKINHYTTLRSQELYEREVYTNLLQIIFYPIGKFIFDYIILLGFLDGTPGIIMALGMSFHSFLVRAKLWHLWEKT